MRWRPEISQRIMAKALDQGLLVEGNQEQFVRGDSEWFKVLSRGGVQSNKVVTRRVGVSTIETTLRTPLLR